MAYVSPADAIGDMLVVYPPKEGLDRPAELKISPPFLLHNDGGDVIRAEQDEVNRNSANSKLISISNSNLEQR